MFGESDHRPRISVTTRDARCAIVNLDPDSARSIDFATLSPRIETVAASLLVLGVVAFDLGLVLNWLQGVGTPLMLIGIGIVLYGVVAAL